MHTMRMVGLLGGLLLMLAVAGCSDNSTSGPETVAPLAYGRGVVVYTPNGLWMQLFISGHDATMPILDSARVGDSLIDRETFSETGDGAANTAYMITFYETGNSSTYMYNLGDTAAISIWGEGRASSCRVKLLSDGPSFAPVMISPASSGNDTLSQGESDTLRWHRVEHADYYAISIAWVKITQAWKYDYGYTTDTTFVINGNLVPDSTYFCYVTITPFNGPDPRTEKSNWGGTLLDGMVFSVGGNGGTDFRVETNLATSKVAAPRLTPDKPSLGAREIVTRVYEKYGQ